jgi:hypothetical protein
VPVTIAYDAEIPYQNLPGLGDQPALAVTLIFSGHQTRTPAIIDSGSNHTVFNLGIAELLGIDNVTEGDPITVSTIGRESVTIYRFPVEIKLEIPPIELQFFAEVSFHPGQLNRNLLGKDLIFQHLQIGFRDKHQRLFLAREH